MTLAWSNAMSTMAPTRLGLVSPGDQRVFRFSYGGVDAGE